MWVAGNWQNASRCGRDKAKRQDCSGRDVVLLPHKHRLVFSLSRNGIRGSKSTMVCQSARRIHGPNQTKKTVVGSWVNCSSSASLTCGWRIVISPVIPQDFPSLLRFCDGQSARFFTIERLSAHQAVFRSFACCKLSIPKELVGASGFEPPTSWSRTRRSSQAEPRPDNRRKQQEAPHADF